MGGGYMNWQQDVVPLTTSSNQVANTDFATFTAPFGGTATLTISLPTASVVNLMGTPKGGTEKAMGAINSGTAIPASEPFVAQWGVTAGAAYALQVATAQTGTAVFSVAVSRP